MSVRGKVSVKLLAVVGAALALVGLAVVHSWRQSESRHVYAATHLKRFGADLELYEKKYHAEPADAESLKRGGQELMHDAYALLRACPECGKTLTYNIPGFGSGKAADPVATPADWPLAWHDCPSREGSQIEILYPKGRLELVDRIEFSAKLVENMKSGTWNPWQPTK